MNDLSFAKESLKNIGFLLFSFSFLLSCNSTNMTSNSTAKTFVTDYLKNRYASGFELISLNRENARGDKTPRYVAQFRSSSYERRNFHVTFSGKDELQINVDEFPIRLLEEAFLARLDIKNYKDFPVVFEANGRFVMEKYLDGINNINDAKAKLASIEESSWDFYIYTLVDTPEKRVTEMEDMIINLLRQAYKIMPTIGSAKIYIYSDTSLTQADLQPDMNIGIIKRTPHKSKVFEEWGVGWHPNKLKSYSNDFQTVVKKRNVIPN